MKRLLLTFLIVVTPLFVAEASTRTWTSSSGKFTVEAELIDFKDGQVHLKRADGQVIRVPLASLCEEDRDFIKTTLPGVQEQQVRPGTVVREWSSKGGGFRTTAEYLGFDDGKVHLRKLDGEEISVPLTALSDTDRDWVREELRRGREEDVPAAGQREDAQEPVEQFGPQTIPMKAVTLEPGRGRGRRANPAVEYYLRMTQPQHFHIEPGKGPGEAEAAFRRIVRSEPQYEAPVPLKGVVKLGGNEFAFALDAVGKRVTGYNRLYFDVNGNGDLTDDKPIEAIDVGGSAAGGIVQSSFPPVSLELTIDGASVQYSVLVSALCGQQPVPFASASVYSATVREGFIDQGGSKTRLVLVDQNTNGRFDDQVAVRLMGGRVRPSEGDLLLVNPNPRDVLSADATMGKDRHYVSKTVCIGKHFYEMEVSPAGDQLTLTPRELAIGYVTNPSPGYRAVAYNDNFGVIMLGGSRGTKIPLPAGQWRVANYSIDASALAGGGRTAVTAVCGEAYQPATVVKDETVELPFGAPFRAIVMARKADAGRVGLSLAIVGAVGENVTSLYVNGRRPPAPRFVITDSEGEVVHQGTFEYG